LDATGVGEFGAPISPASSRSHRLSSSLRRIARSPVRWNVAADARCPAV